MSLTIKVPENILNEKICLKPDKPKTKKVKEINNLISEIQNTKVKKSNTKKDKQINKLINIIEQEQIKIIPKEKKTRKKKVKPEPESKSDKEKSESDKEESASDKEDSESDIEKPQLKSDAELKEEINKASFKELTKKELTEAVHALKRVNGAPPAFFMLWSQKYLGISDNKLINKLQKLFIK